MVQRIGGRRHRVNIEEISRGTANDYGVRTETWSEFISAIWVSIEPQSGREYQRARQTTPELTHLIGMIYHPSVAPKMRVNFGGRILDIEFVENVDERNRDLFLHCVEQV